MVRWLIPLALAAACVSGCVRDEPAAGAPDAAPLPDGADFPPPRTDLVPAVGSARTFDVATWNIENFPRTPVTITLVADLIASMDLDLIAVQEIEDVAAWNELVARLPEHAGLLSSHTYGNGTYQKVGFLYREDLVSLEADVLLFDRDGYEFPRPPLQALATVDDGVHPPLDLVVITMHLKAGRDFEDRDRREEAIVMLEEHISGTVVGGGLDSEVIALGDFNEVVTTSDGRAVFDPFLTAPQSYFLHTDEAAAAGEFTFVPSGVILDHVISTAALSEERAGGQDLIPPLHAQLDSYSSSVSDHLPVVIQLPIFE